MENGYYIGRSDYLWRCEVWSNGEITHIMVDDTKRKVKRALRNVTGYTGTVRKIGPF